MTADVGPMLAEFVIESNRIEDAPAWPGHPLFDDHLAAALWVHSMAGNGILLTPKQIHARVMGSEPGAQPGQYRDCPVSVGGRICPDADEVHPRMVGLLWRVDSAIKLGEAFSKDELWGLHHCLEFIHPFIDGNGRVGRLWLNMLRLRFGYPWLTVRYNEREAYYQSIQDWIGER